MKEDWSFDWVDGLLLVVFPIMYLALLTLLGFAGCAKTPLTTPQSGGVTGGINRVQTGVSTAQAQHSEITKKNVEARTALDRADSKDAVIKAWKAWKKEHP